MILPVMLLVGAACHSPEPQATSTGPDVEAIEAWLGQCDAAINSGEYESFLSLLAADALLMPPDSPPLSIDDLRSIYEAMFRENTLHMTSRVDEVVVSGDIAVVRASYEETVTPRGGGEPTSMSGPWLITLRKQSDGSWKGWHNMWTVVPPAPPPM